MTDLTHTLIAVSLLYIAYTFGRNHGLKHGFNSGIETVLQALIRLKIIKDASFEDDTMNEE